MDSLRLIGYFRVTITVFELHEATPNLLYRQPILVDVWTFADQITAPGRGAIDGIVPIARRRRGDFSEAIVQRLAAVVGRGRSCTFMIPLVCA